MSVHQNRLAETAMWLRTGDLDPSTYLGTAIDRFEAVESDVHSFVTRPDPEHLRSIGEDLERRYRHRDRRPPLYGVPVGVKDIFHVEGLPTNAGADLPADRLAGEEGTALKRLRDAGAFPMGKTVTTEFAYFAPGPTRNPHDLDHTPGGSSSGSAAAVAAGLCPLALGTQTVGSTIRPAAFCGIVGYKPTLGRIPTDGLLTFSETVDHVGVFTQDVAGARLAGSVLADDWTPAELDGRPVLGVPTGAYLNRADDEGRSRFREQVEDLRAAGYDVKEVTAFDDFEELSARHNRIIAAEFALVHHEWFEEYGERYDERTADLIEEGRQLGIDEMGADQVARRNQRDEVQRRMADHGVDVWVAPAAPGPAPEGIDSTGNPVMNLPWTHLGMPAITIPGGDVDGLPMGLQCVAATGDDEQLLAWAGELEHLW